MPLYEYTCKTCGNDFEELVLGDVKPECPSCGSAALTKNMSAPAAHANSGAKDPACPVQSTCGATHCCGQNCGMGDFL
ncbi:MAG: zinc ribbon domain-containing protein [Pirellulales bacterium]|nr:zinc ribbon domain-containing protein [Pirellulales bacterium]